MSDLDRLRAFAQELFEASDWPHGGDIDGLAFQEIAEHHGLLVRVQMIAPCGKNCFCAEYGADFPTACLRKSQILTGTP